MTEQEFAGADGAFNDDADRIRPNSSSTTDRSCKWSASQGMKSKISIFLTFTDFWGGA
jgi:hypothetical protein